MPVCCIPDDGQSRNTWRKKQARAAEGATNRERVLKSLCIKNAISVSWVRGLNGIIWDYCSSFCLQLSLLLWRSSHLHRVAPAVVYSSWASVVSGLDGSELKLKWGYPNMTSCKLLLSDNRNSLRCSSKLRDEGGRGQECYQAATQSWFQVLTFLLLISICFVGMGLFFPPSICFLS